MFSPAAMEKGVFWKSYNVCLHLLEELTFCKTSQNGVILSSARNSPKHSTLLTLCTAICQQIVNKSLRL